jgi:hypothetical protein
MGEEASPATASLDWDEPWTNVHIGVLAASKLLNLLRPECHAHPHAANERRVMAPPSGEDTLQVRQTYLRRHRARHVGTWQRTAIRFVVAASVCWLCIAGFTVFVFGS